VKLPFGLEIRRQKSLNTLTSVSSQWNWWSPLGIHEPWTGAWQANAPEVDRVESILAFSAVFACVTGIAGDIAKCRIKLDRENAGIWDEVTANSPWLPVLRKPNHYQNRIKFIEQYIVSELLNGNTYVLKERDARGIVTRLYVLDPNRVTVLISDNGDVFYELRTDYLSQLDDTVTVPASEIIHDMMVSLWHPLIGVSPIYACGMSATMGNKIQANSTGLFGNRSTPGGILTAPGSISNETAERMKRTWEEKFTGANVGRLAVLGDGLKYEQITMTATDAQLIEQLRWTVEDVARAFHYPMYKLGGPLPPYSSSPEALTLMYYSDCLQIIIEKFELSLDEGLSLPSDMCTEMDLDNLMRMDTTALFESNNKAVAGGWMSPDEARFRKNMHPVSGGDTPYLQQQNYSLAALAKRDAQADPFASNSAAPAQPANSEPVSKGLSLTRFAQLSDEVLVAK